MSEVRPRLKNARKPQARSLPLRRAILDITGEYERLTVRQLCYQLSSRGFIEKMERAFDRAGDAAVQLRLCGELSFGKIADGHRSRRRAGQWDGVPDLLDTVVSVYRRDYWSGQVAGVEVWCEKDALTGVIQPICDEYGVTYVATRGYPSLTLLYETAQAIGDRLTWIFYFGDHDASGRGISDGIPGRLEEFGANVRFVRVGLEPTQIREYGLQTRPGKKSDTRHAGFAKKFGSGDSVELDALPPNVLEAMVRDSIESRIDWDEWKRMEAVEVAERESVVELAGHWKRPGRGKRR